MLDPVELVEQDEAVESFRRSLWCLLPELLLLGFSSFSLPLLLLLSIPELVLELLECCWTPSVEVLVDNCDILLDLTVPEFVLPGGAAVTVEFLEVLEEVEALVEASVALLSVEEAMTVVDDATVSVDDDEEEEEEMTEDTFGVGMLVVVAVAVVLATNANDSFTLVLLLPLVLARLLLLLVKLLLLLLLIFVLDFSVKLILLFKILVFGLFARVAKLLQLKDDTVELDVFIVAVLGKLLGVAHDPGVDDAVLCVGEEEADAESEPLLVVAEANIVPLLVLPATEVTVLAMESVTDAVKDVELGTATDGIDGG